MKRVLGLRARSVTLVIKGCCSHLHVSVKERFCGGLPTLHFGAGSLDSGRVCDALEAGQGFWGDALTVVEPEHKGHGNNWPSQPPE